MSTKRNPIKPFMDKNCEARFDINTSLAVITYRNTINPRLTASVYEWMGKSLAVGLEHKLIMTGCIFDFSRVTLFESSNLGTAHNKHKDLKKTHASALEQFPIALIARTSYQAAILRTMMRLNEQPLDHPRIKMVKTMEAAEAFIKQWHEIELERTGNMKPVSSETG